MVGGGGGVVHFRVNAYYIDDGDYLINMVAMQLYSTAAAIGVVETAAVAAAGIQLL